MDSWLMLADVYVLCSYIYLHLSLSLSLLLSTHSYTYLFGTVGNQLSYTLFYLLA